jgi:hypothetical protein
MARPKVPPQYGQAFLQCRTFGHVWRIAEQGPDVRTGAFTFTLACDVCGTQRIDRLNRRSGGVMARRYEYPDGYQDNRHEGQVQRTLYRIEFIRRVTR